VQVEESEIGSAKIPYLTPTVTVPGCSYPLASVMLEADPVSVTGFGVCVTRQPHTEDMSLRRYMYNVLAQRYHRVVIGSDDDVADGQGRDKLTLHSFWSPATLELGPRPRCNLTRAVGRRMSSSHLALLQRSIRLLVPTKATVLSEPCDLLTIYCALVCSVYCRPIGRAGALSAGGLRMRRQSRLLLRIGEDTLPRLVLERRQATTVARVRVG
jgi:hypothetical protein